MKATPTHKYFKELEPHIVKKFFSYHKENPQVYKMVKKFANEAKEAGRTHFGIKMIWERMRWYSAVESTDTTYRLSNDYPSCYARLLMIENPIFETIFSRKGKKK